MTEFLVLKSYLLLWIGDYIPLSDSDGNIIGGFAGLDYAWIFSALCFCIMLVGVLCIIRTMLRALFN